jgi:hypothetical protein
VAQEQETGLKRDIGFWGSSFLSFNGLVGAGIFALPATLYTQFGTFSPWLFPLFGALALLVALPFSRLGRLPSGIRRAGRLHRPVRAAGRLPDRLDLLCRARHRAGGQQQCFRNLRRLALAAARARAWAGRC